jgi:GntR family transcriptional repressor for pyruvate dehydrogenase complex
VQPPAAAALPTAALGRETLSDRLARLLAAQIESAELSPGQRLPTEAQLAATHGVSRSVVREAVHRIKSRGLLVSRQGSGVFVAAVAPHHSLAFDPEVMMSVDRLIEVAEVRRVLEREMAALAALRATRVQVAGLRKALAAIDAATAAGADGVAEDMAFHRAIGEATGNPQFSRLLAFLEQYLRDGMRITRANEARRSDFMQAVRDEHRSLVDAIAAGDSAAARRAATRHLTLSARRLEHGGLLARGAVSDSTQVAPSAPTRRTKR